MHPADYPQDWYGLVVPLVCGEPLRLRYAKEGSGVYVGLCAMLLCRCAQGEVLTVSEAKDTREAGAAGRMRSKNGGQPKCLGTSSTAQGGGGSFKNRKPIGKVGCCESRMAERIH